MRKMALPGAILGGVIVAALQAAPAYAQATRTWVSGVGDDVNPCSRTAPCKTFAGAISKTAVGGEINCLDSGGFGAVTITKSITIKCEGVIAGVLVSGTNGIIINDSGSGTPGTAIVMLSGLDLEGLGTGINGVLFSSGGELHMHKLQIRNFRQSGAGGNGVSVAHSSNTGVNKKVFLVDSYISNNGGTSANAGLLVKPTGGANVNVMVSNTTFEANANGILADGSGGGGGVNVSVRHSLVGNNTSAGISAQSAGGSNKVTVDGSMIAANGTSGLAAGGGQGTIRVGSSTITHNVTGASGNVLSFKNNQFVDNVGDGTPLVAVSSGGNILN
jgi:hypothetical protein